jgi:hypothetical protein
LSFAAIYGAELGMVLSGHYYEEIMPVGADVYQPNSRWLGNKIGDIDHVACEHSETSYMSSSSDRIRAGVKHCGSQLPVLGWEEPQLDDWVYKTGQTTGTTLGLVVLFYETYFGQCGYIRHQCLAAMDCDYGDSGAPVYWIDWVNWWPALRGTIESGQFEVAVLKGVLFAGWPGGYALFSPIDLTMADLDVYPLPGPFG